MVLSTLLFVIGFCFYLRFLWRFVSVLVNYTRIWFYKTIMERSLILHLQITQFFLLQFNLILLIVYISIQISLSTYHINKLN